MSSIFTPISEQDVRSISSTQNAPLGAVSGTFDGRIYRYGKAGAVNLSHGKVVVTPAVVSNHTNRTISAAAAAGAFAVSVSNGGTAATLDQYKDGYLTINDAAGEGYSYRIEGNDAAGTSDAVAVRLAEPVITALTTSSEGTLHVNPYSAVIVSPSAIAHHAVGVPNVDITAAYFGWFQVRGYCSVLSDGAITKGAGAILSDAVDGAVEIEVAATVVQRVGTAPEATVDTEYRTLDLTLL